MYKLIRPILFKLTKDPETVHNLALRFLKFLGYPPIKDVVSAFTEIESKTLEQNIFNLNFRNPVGLAGGFDKDGKIVNGLESLGFGFLEIGTITKLPQSGNARPRMFRLPDDNAVINRMGFNNIGVVEIKNHLQKVKHKSILGISLGKNKITLNELAVEDYLFLFKEMYNLGNYFVVNFSSPNTPGLRDLQDKKLLTNILEHLVAYRKTRGIAKPILVKITIDFSFNAVDEILEVCKNVGVDGIISSNTSVSRDNLKTVTYETGGISGRPIAQKSTELIRYIHKKNIGLPIIGVGGIFTPEDAYEKIKAGASLIQIYTGFIYEGPFIVKKINQGLVKLLEQDGFKNISEAVGVDAK